MMLPGISSRVGPWQVKLVGTCMRLSPCEDETFGDVVLNDFQMHLELNETATPNARKRVRLNLPIDV